MKTALGNTGSLWLGAVDFRWNLTLKFQIAAVFEPCFAIDLNISQKCAFSNKLIFDPGRGTNVRAFVFYFRCWVEFVFSKTPHKGDYVWDTGVQLELETINSQDAHLFLARLVI